MICADQIYRTHAIRAFCLRHAIRLSGTRLGRPKSDQELLAEDKHQFPDDQGQRNAVAAEGLCEAVGKIGQSKRRFGLVLIRDKLAVSQGSTIALNVMVMNLQKLLELLFIIFVALLQLLLVDRGQRNIRTMPLNAQMAAALLFELRDQPSPLLLALAPDSLSQEVHPSHLCGAGGAGLV